MVEDLRRGDDSTAFLPFVKSNFAFFDFGQAGQAFFLSCGCLADMMRGMDSICFLAMAAVVCGGVFGDTVPVPVPEGGKVVLREFDNCRGGTVASVLRAADDYGVMLVNVAADEGEPRMMIVVARRHPAEVYRVDSLDELEAVIRKFPAGAQFYWYDRCLAPAGYGLPEDTWEKVEGVMHKCGHRLSGDNDTRIRCTCSGDASSLRRRQ